MVQNTQQPFLGYDEAVQFWVSKGLEPNEEPLSPEGSLSAVLDHNKKHNLDPGGYGIQMYFWSKLSNHHAWLRLLSFGWFVGLAIGIWYFFSRVFRRKLVGLLLSLLPLLSVWLIKMSVEIRAYSMEAFAAFFVVTSIIYLLHSKPGHLYHLLTGLCTAFLITGRYPSFVLAVLAIFYLGIRLAANRESLRKSLVSWAAYALPIIVVLVILVFQVMMHQNPSLASVSYVYYLNDPVQLKDPKYLLFGVLLILTLVYRIRNKQSSKHKGLYVCLDFVLLTNAAFIVLSFLGIYPWLPFTQKGLSLIIPMLLVIGYFVGGVLNHVLSQSGTTGYAGIGAVVLIVLSSHYSKLDVRIEESLVHSLADFCPEEDKSIYVFGWESPGVRYLYEYGALKGRCAAYPAQFYLASLQGNSAGERGHAFTPMSQQQSLQEVQEDVHYNTADYLVIPQSLVFVYKDLPSLDRIGRIKQKAKPEVGED